MEKAIWKFILGVEDIQDIEMPEESEILTIQPQHDKICIWAIVNPRANKETRRFMIKGTGHIFDDADLINTEYLGSVQTNAGSLIWHIFEVND